MSLFEIGADWPPKDSVDRLNNYNRYKLLYAGDLATWEAVQRQGAQVSYPRKPGEDGEIDYTKLRQQRAQETPARKKYKVMNLMKFIVEKFQELIFNRPIRLNKVKANEQAAYAIRRNIRDTKLNEAGSNALHDRMVLGDAVLKIRVSDNVVYAGRGKQVYVDNVPPQYYFPEFVGGSMSEVSTAHIAIPKKIKTTTAMGEKELTYLCVETHYAGKIVYRLFQVEKNKITREIPHRRETEYSKKLFQDWMNGSKVDADGKDIPEPPPEYETPSEYWTAWPEVAIMPNEANSMILMIDTKADRSLIFHLGGSATSPWGESVFAGDLTPLDEINRKLGGLAHIHDVLSRPRLLYPESRIRASEVINGKIELDIDDIITYAQDDEADKIKYLELQGNGPEMIARYIDSMVDTVMMLKSAPRSLLKPGEGGGESGIAIDKKTFSTALKTNSLIGKFNRLFSEMLWYAQILEVNWKLTVEISAHNTDGEPSEAGTYNQALHIRQNIADYEPEWPVITITPYGLVPSVDVTNTRMKLDAGLITREDAYLEANPDEDPEQIRDVLDTIDEEMAARQAATPEGQTRNDFLGNLAGQRDQRNMPNGMTPGGGSVLAKVIEQNQNTGVA